MDGKTQRVLLAAVAGILAAAGTVGLTQRVQAEEESEDAVPCYGINKCKGIGACGGMGHSCAGQNACKGQGYIELHPDDCLKIQEGRLTAEQPPADQS